MSRKKMMAAAAAALLFTGLAVTDGLAAGGGGGGGGHGGGFGGGGGGHGGGFAAGGGGGAHMGGGFGGGHLGSGFGSARPQGGVGVSGIPRGQSQTFRGDRGYAGPYGMAYGERDRHGEHFHDRGRGRHRFGLFAPYADYGYACDYSYPGTYWPGYSNGCVAPYQGWSSYGW